MNRFEYASPETIESAVQLLDRDSLALAGGTDLLSLMKDGVVKPSRLVSIKEIPDLRGIKASGSGGLEIGALTTVEEILDSPEIRDGYPALHQAAQGIRSAQIQSVGTVGGDLCQRPRCWYFRNGFGLLAEHDGKSMVVDGDNRYHAILGNAGPAYFVNPSSFAPALVALSARLRLAGPGASRDVSVADFFRSPSREGESEFVLAANELVTHISLGSTAGANSATYEVRQKEALDWPLAAAAAVLDMNGDTVSAARIVLGHVAPTPWPAPAAEQAIVGKKVSAETAEAAGRAAIQGARPLSRNGYKVQLAQVAVKRAILRAAGMEVI